MDNNLISWYPAIVDLTSACQKLSIAQETEITEYNLDQFYEWMLSDKTTVDCERFLDFWNITSDLAYSANDMFCGDTEEYISIYDKLFYGSNLPSINSSQDKYSPTWDISEIKMLKSVIQSGLHLFAKYLNA